MMLLPLAFRRLMLLLLLSGSAASVAQVALVAQPGGLVPVGLGWARNNVNGAVFRKNSVVTHQQTQYTAFYDSVGYIVLGRRTLPAGTWQVQRTRYQGKVSDAHNIISLMVDGAGYLHLSFDHHGNPLRYCRSVAPNSLELTDLLPMTGKQESNVTYPEFYRYPDGDLLFVYRDGSSGNGNMVLNRYSTKSKQWTRLHDVLIDGEGQRNAYWQATLDARGTLHVSWVWRESPDVASNHDMAYARSLDGGKTWQKSTGEAYQLPITEKTAEYACRIPQRSELINQTSMATDAQGNPYIATYWRPAGSTVPQYQLIYLANKQWRVAQVGQRTTPFSLSGAGTKKIPISRPQVVVGNGKSNPPVYVLYRDVERQDRVSITQCPDLTKNQWTTKDLNTEPVGNWEPSYDTERWRQTGRLNLFVQRTGQGDGETLEKLKPQPVYILEWAP
ncbi:BNR repeat-containing protein [uncultured Hymenobacter sp.]|uniref:BNR repeat-containing protein n=1 Tax=uncultured Hymenobacter sp. TaxID=170016 RepID=UPI0035CA0AB3